MGRLIPLAGGVYIGTQGIPQIPDGFVAIIKPEPSPDTPTQVGFRDSTLNPQINFGNFYPRKLPDFPDQIARLSVGDNSKAVVVETDTYNFPPYNSFDLNVEGMSESIEMLWESENTRYVGVDSGELWSLFDANQGEWLGVFADNFSEILEPPLITAQPQDQTVDAGDDATFTCEFNHSQVGVTVYWIAQTSVDDGESWITSSEGTEETTGTPIEVETVNSDSQVSESGYLFRFRFRAYADNNSQQTMSATAMLTVNDT
ncbi:hypothetical protein VCHA30O60_50128 [Vibrio chagasii]|nr:hypothetical protein VCHA30O60_50128 [Vibrio chagasii]